MRLDVVVRRVLHHVVERRLLVRIAPLDVLARRQRQRGVEHRVDDVDERHLRDDRLEQVRPHVDDGADQQAARAAALNHQSIRGGVAVLDQVLRAVDEIGEGVHLLHHAALLAPFLAHLAAATDVGVGVDDAAIEQAQPARTRTSAHRTRRTSRSRIEAAVPCRRARCPCGTRWTSAPWSRRAPPPTRAWPRSAAGS